MSVGMVNSRLWRGG